MPKESATSSLAEAIGLGFGQDLSAVTVHYQPGLSAHKPIRLVKRRWMSLGEEYDPSQPVADHIISTA